MKKIPTLFIREFDGKRIVKVTPAVTPGMEWVLDGAGEATLKIDGSCCAILDGVFYKRYDAKRGKQPPAEAIPCCDPDPITGHWPHWVPVSAENPNDKWFLEAFRNTEPPLADGTYEAIGPHFRGNPYGLAADSLQRHGAQIIADMPRSFDGIREYLRDHDIEGVVFWRDGAPQCKIKRTDFGFRWPNREIDS
jgi:hypothetical protein